MFKQSQRRTRSLRMLVAGGVVGVLGALAIGVGLQLGNPFSTDRVDHSAPPVLVQLRDLADYHAAQGQFEVTIDQEDDVRWVPSFLAGERVQFIAVATVDAVVDFSAVGSDAVTVDGTSVSVTLPSATLADPVLDQDLSHVMNRDRGIVNRVAGMFSDNPTGEQALYQAASDKVAAAAAASSLEVRAETNTRSMLQTMFRSMGYEQVTVTFG
ncbi:MAG: DUF4230 domain-containing protein [Ilumatobacteraceae bacterium]